MNSFVYFSLFFTLLVICEHGTNAQSHNMEWGKKEESDKQLHREIAMMEYKFMKVITMDVNFTAPDSTKITYIKATDQYTNGNGGYATISNGGPGEKDVSIHIKSQRNHGFNFIIEIFGQ